MVTNDSSPARRPPLSKASAWRKTGIAIGLLGAGFALGAVNLASASGGMGGFGPPWAGHGWGHGARIGFLQHMVRNQLEEVGATTAQEDKIHDIIAASFTELDTGKAKQEEMRKQVFSLFRAPTIDRAAVEKLRADKMAEVDAKSKKVVGAMIDAASQLTPEQRSKLVERLEDRIAHPRWGFGGWHRWGGPWHEGPSPDGKADKGSDDHG